MKPIAYCLLLAVLLPLRVAAADQMEEAQLRISAGLYQEAEGLMQDALAASQPAGDLIRRAGIQMRLGDLYLLTDRIDEAQASLNKAVMLARQAGDLPTLVDADISQGNLKARKGENERALEHYVQAARHAVELNDKSREATARINATRISLEIGLATQALAQLRLAAEKVQQLPDSRRRLSQWLALGWLARRLAEALPEQRGELQFMAFGFFNTAARLAEDHADVRGAGFAYGSLGGLYLQAQRYPEARALLRKAVFLSRQAAAPEHLYRWLWWQGRAQRQLGNIQAAVAEYRAAVAVLQQVRPQLHTGQRGPLKGFRDTAGRLYYELADLLLQKPEQAQTMTLHARRLAEARETVELLKAAELQDYFNDNCVTALRARTSGIDQLDTATAVLYAIPLPDRLELLLSLPGGMQQISVPISADTLQAEIVQFRRKLENRTTHRYIAHARRLYDWLVRPVEEQLAKAGIQTLVTVPQGAMAGIPFGALHDGKQFLVQKYALATTPGLALTDPKALSRQSLAILTAGLSEAVQGFPSLPHVPAEIEAIQALYDGETYQDAGFSRANLRQAFEKVPYSVVHIASHAQFKGRSNETFLLTYDEKLNLDGLEQLIGISEFREQPVELLTLSACQTAAGDEQAALGLAGIAIKAGARSAIATLWFVNDASTSNLIRAFYRQLQEPAVSKARALQLAQINTLKDRRYRHPAYWAPFLLIGNWL